MPTIESASPSAHAISVAEGRNDTILISRKRRQKERANKKAQEPQINLSVQTHDSIRRSVLLCSLCLLWLCAFCASLWLRVRRRLSYLSSWLARFRAALSLPEVALRPSALKAQLSVEYVPDSPQP